MKESSGAVFGAIAPKRPVNPQLRTRFDTRREQLVDIAASLYAANGYDATSIDDLLQASASSLRSS